MKDILSENALDQAEKRIKELESETAAIKALVYVLLRHSSVKSKQIQQFLYEYKDSTTCLRNSSGVKEVIEGILQKSFK